MSSASPLNYAPRPPAHRRNFRRLGFITALLALTVLAWCWAPPAWRRVKLLYWQHQCMVYTPPPDQVIFNPKLGAAGNIVAAPWRKFYTLYSPPGSSGCSTVFLHEMKKPNGDERLVAIEMGHVSATSEARFRSVSRVFLPGSLLAAPTEISPTYGGRSITLAASRQCSLAAGRIDPADPTHLTIQATASGEPIIYDGWLQNDDTLTLGERKSLTPAR